ncbi:MAG: gsiC 2, partial [Frondihabitans sp.]|nr:gsiC 2 [Frondihabitans sp.]
MLRYLVRRLAQAVLVLWAAYSLSFVLLTALPGNAILNKIKAPDSGLTPADGTILLAYYGLDKPVWVQYLTNLGNLLRGDLGYSLSNGSPVSKLIGVALPSSLALTGVGFVIALVLAG